jgi:hypothetical protein
MPESLEPIKREIQNFLANDYPQVMAIKGKWGTGKTYTWKKLLKDIGKSSELFYKKYSYVSLFGVQSIDDIYSSIFIKTMDSSNVIDNPTLKGLWKNVLSLKDGRGESLSLIGKMKNFTSFNEYYKNAASLAVRETIVCIDDLERRSYGIKLKDLMGLVSQLKEQRNCKVMLILNEDVLSGSDQEDFRLFAEKVIDVQLLFDPKPEECIEIVINKDKWYYNQVNEIARELNIKNIRLLQRIKFVLDKVNKYLTGFSDQSKKDTVLATCIFAWCHYCSDDNAPSVDFVKGYNKYSIQMSPNSMRRYVGKDEEQSEEDKLKEKWVDTLGRVSYTNTSELDLVIADYIITGILNDSKLSAQEEFIKKQEEYQEAREQFEAIWRQYWDSFDDNASEIRDSFKEYFEKYYSFANLNELDVAVSLLKKIGFESDATSITVDFFERNVDRWEEKDLLTTRVLRDVNDKYVLKKIEEIIAKTKPEITLESALKNIYENDIAAQNEMEFLSQVSSDEFYKLFKECSHDDVPIFIHASLCYNRIINADVNAQALVKNAADALRRISKENTINYQRVSSHFGKWGIEL